MRGGVGSSTGLRREKELEVLGSNQDEE